MATRGIDGAPAILSVFLKSGENGGGKCTGGRGMELGVSQTSPGEGITPGQAGSCLARPRRSPTTCVPAGPELKTHVPLWLGWARLGEVSWAGVAQVSGLLFPFLFFS